ncbi:MAG: dienelactone hydrolase family protein [Candidatus Zixiibacteriota bacterium]|nr:MAG: dienelactone hydrolase family protein [candidate division Zixibacteria bacterium]
MKPLLIVILILIIPVSVLPQNDDSLSGLQSHKFEKELIRQVSANYLLYLPRNYSQKEKWPLILYLHGGRGRGDDLSLLDWYPLPKMLAQNDPYPFVALIPQCPAGKMWTDTELLKALLDDIVMRYRVDSDRIYLVGYSMGGTGAWYMTYRYPEMFAAIAPISGNTNPWWASRMKDIPIWAFHGRKDKLVPVSETEEMAEAIRKEGGSIKVSIDPERGHSPPSIAQHKELFEWLLMQKKNR